MGKLSQSISVDGVSYHSLRVTKYPQSQTPAILVVGGKNDDQQELVSINSPRQALRLQPGEFFVRNNLSAIIRKLLENGDIVLIGQSFDNGTMKVEIAKIA